MPLIMSRYYSRRVVALRRIVGMSLAFIRAEGRAITLYLYQRSGYYYYRVYSSRTRIYGIDRLKIALRYG